jgi:hypothetical protein
LNVNFKKHFDELGVGLGQDAQQNFRPESSTISSKLDFRAIEMNS